MDPHVAGGLFSAVGAFVGAGVALLGGWLARRHERERADAAWSRDKVLEAYSGCLYYSVLLGVRAAERSAKEDREVGQQYAEAQRHLLLLRAYSGDPEVRARLARHSEQLLAAWDRRAELSEAADALADEVGNLLAADRRVNPPLGDIRPAAAGSSWEPACRGRCRVVSYPAILTVRDEVADAPTSPCRCISRAVQSPGGPEEGRIVARRDR